MSRVGHNAAGHGFAALVGAALALGALTVVAAAGPASAESPTGSISGTVQVPTSQSGGSSGHSPADVVIDLFDRTSGTWVATTRASATGAFSFTSLPDGDYGLGFGGYVYPYQYWPAGWGFRDSSVSSVRVSGGQARRGIVMVLQDWQYMAINGWVHKAGNSFCFGYIGLVAGDSESQCSSTGETNEFYAGYGFRGGQDYIVWATEYDPTADKYTNILYWNDTGLDRRFFGNFTPYVLTPEYFGKPTDFRLDRVPFIGTDPTDIVMTSSIAPLYVGATTKLTAYIIGAGPKPTGTVAFFDDEGYIGTGTLSNGVASTTYTVTHATEWLLAVEFAGDGTYDWSSWDIDFQFMPTIDLITPAHALVDGGSSVTITGYALTGATSVTFDGVPGTNLVVVSDTEITVTTPAGTAGPAVVIVTNSFGASVPGTFLFEIPAVSRTPAAPPARVVCPDGTRVDVNGPPCHVRVGPTS